MRHILAVAVVVAIFNCAAVAQSSDPVERLPFSPAEQSAYLHSVIQDPSGNPAERGKNWRVVRPYILGGNVSQTSSGMYCSGGGTASVTSDTTASINTSSVCRALADYRHAATLWFDNPAAPADVYFVLLSCEEKYIWDHCDMQEYGGRGGMVLEETGKPIAPKFTVSVATTEKLGDKPKVARFDVVSVWRLHDHRFDAKP